jgi:hypothetical protein
VSPSAVTADIILHTAKGFSANYTDHVTRSLHLSLAGIAKDSLIRFKQTVTRRTSPWVQQMFQKNKPLSLLFHPIPLSPFLDFPLLDT